VVIFIISILAALTFPAVKSVWDTAVRTQASMMALDLETGVMSYIADNGTVPPIGTVDSHGNRVVESVDDWELLCSVLNGGRYIDDQTPNPDAIALNPTKTTHTTFKRRDYKQGSAVYRHVISPYNDMGVPLRYVMVLDANHDMALQDLPTRDGKTMGTAGDVAIYLMDVDNPGHALVNTYE